MNFKQNFSSFLKIAVLYSTHSPLFKSSECYCYLTRKKEKSKPVNKSVIKPEIKPVQQIVVPRDYSLSLVTLLYNDDDP